MLTTTELAEISGLPQTTLNVWAASGHIRPAIRGTGGRGSPTRWDVMQSVGLCVAGHVYLSERGCVLSYVVSIVDAFERLSEADLQKMIRKGEVYFVMVHLGKPLLRPENEYDWPHVGQIYNDVKDRLAVAK